MELIILLIFSFFVEATVAWQYSSALFIPSYGLKIRLALLSILYTILLLLFLLGQTWINTFSFFIVNALFLYICFQLKFLSSLFHSAILTSIMGVTELGIFAVLSDFFPHFLLKRGMGLIFFAVFSKIFFCAAVYFLIYCFKWEKEKKQRHGQSEMLFIIIPISSVFIMFTLLFIGEHSAFVPPVNFLVTVCALFLLLINLLVFAINQYQQKKAEDYANLQLQLQKESNALEYYEMLLAQRENHSILIHDIKKHLQSLQLLNEKKDSEGIHAYIEKIMDSSSLKEKTKICDNEMLNSILCRFERRCKDKHIQFYSDIRSHALEDMSLYDLTALFSNLLDNAVESAQNTPDAFIELRITCKKNMSSALIVLINSCNNAPVYGQDGLPISQKAGSRLHGFGVKSIKKVIKNYCGDMTMYYDKDSATFHTVIVVERQTVNTGIRSLEV